MHKCTPKIEQLQEIIKIYLIAVGGSTAQLGGIACVLIDILTDLCGDDQSPDTISKLSKQIDCISIGLIKTMYISIVERLEHVSDQGATDHKSACSAIEESDDLLLHLSVLKSVTLDLSIATEVDYTPIFNKIQEVEDAVLS